MEYILVLQWPGSSSDDYDELIGMESELERSLSKIASVDGHDFGSGEMNIYVDTNRPSRAFDEVAAILDCWPRWAEVRAAYRTATGEDYTVLRPLGQTGFRVE